jgi:hypothetical protein
MSHRTSTRVDWLTRVPVRWNIVVCQDCCGFETWQRLGRCDAPVEVMKLSATLYRCGQVEPAARAGVTVRWQYLRVQVATTEIAKSDELLGQLGADGWELAGSAPNDSYAHLWFKRQV